MSAHLARFAQLCDALAATTKKLEKRDKIAEWLKGLSLEDAARGVLYLAGQPFAETDTRSLNLGGSTLTKAVAEVSRASPAAMHVAYLRHGDLGSAAEELLASDAKQTAALTLADVEGALSEIAAAKGPAAKLKLAVALLSRATPLEAKYLIKLALGDMRIGVKQSLVEEAIAYAFHAAPAAVRRATMLKGNLPEVLRLAASGTLEEAGMSLFHPLGFMLASPVDSVEEALARFATEIAAEHAGLSDALPPGKRGAVPAVVESPITVLREAQIVLREAQIEDKYDGIRAQLHCGDPEQPGRVALFSRSRELMTESFPEIADAFAALRTPLILDGEILAWDTDTQRALSFSTLQQRIGRKRVTEEMRRQAPVVFMAFDLLYLAGDLLLERPLSERRRALEDFMEKEASTLRSGFRTNGKSQTSLFSEDRSESIPRLVLAPASRLETAEQLDRAYLDARTRGNEGVMIKALNSIYQPGRRGLAWLKLKRELATLDVVVTAAEFGHGKRAGVLSDYTFAVRAGDQLKNVGKAYSGLTDAEIAELTQYFKKHTIEDFGYVRSVEPLLVLEVAFNNVMRSDRHDSGFALRFPRILRIRRDKPAAEIDTLARVEEIYNSQPDKPVENGPVESV